MTKINIISGFLGAGKTTFIKRLISEVFQGEKLVLIENEFGEIGVDGGFLQEAGIQITEMISGCICCSLVGDFTAALEETIKTYQPDRILIEPSGVGKLSDVQAAVRRVAGEEISVEASITVADCTKCRIYKRNFGEFYEDQIQYADCVLLTRTDKASIEKIEQAVEIVRGINQEARVITTHLDLLSREQILEAFQKSTMEEELMEEAKHAHHHHNHEHHHDEHCTCGCHDHDHHDHHHDHDHAHDEHCTCGCHDHDHHDHHHDHDHAHDEHCTCGCHDHDHHEHHHDHDHAHDEHCTCGCHDHDHHEHHHDHDHAHDEHCTCGCHDHDHHDYHYDHDHAHDEHCTCGCHDHHHHHHADETFSSWGIETVRKYTQQELEKILEALDSGEYGSVLRAKGMVDSEANWLYFDYVPEEHEVRTGSACITGKICVIGSQLNEEKLAELFGKAN